MARMAREEVFSPDEIAIVHVMNRVVRRAFLLGTDKLTGKNYDHRKPWIEDLIKRFATYFGIDVLTFAILSHKNGDTARCLATRTRTGTQHVVWRRTVQDICTRR